LFEGEDLIFKYRKMHLIAKTDFQFVPLGIIEGFIDFCKETGMKYSIDSGLSSGNIKKNEAYLAISDRDLINLVQHSKSNHMKLGRDMGIISYDDTPLKSILMDGITTISTDFNHMGKMAAKIIKEGIRNKFENPSRLIVRASI